MGIILNMVKENKKNGLIVVSWILVIMWMAVIFMFSSMNSDNSSSVSKGLIGQTIKVSSEVGSKIGLIREVPDDEKMEEMVKSVHIPIRKLAHFTEYMILCFLLILALVVSKVSLKNVFWIAIGICFLYACSDEAHQLFINGRAGKFIDVLIDTCGGILGLFISYFGIKKVGKFKKRIAIE